MKKLTDEELIVLYRSGKEEAFNELYERYVGLVKYFCRNLYLLGAEEADLVQEGMLGIIKAVNGYKSGQSSFRTYLTACVRSSLFTAVKKYADLKSFPLNGSVKLDDLDSLGVFSPPPEDFILKVESGNELTNKIYSNLSSLEKKVLTYYLEGYSYPEIAKMTGKGVKSIANALSRCRNKIITRLGE